MDNRPPLEELLKISVFEWARLGAELGVSEDTLKEIERRYPNNEAACRREMFAAWVESEGEVVTRAAVISALKAMQDNTSAEWYESYCKRDCVVTEYCRRATQQHLGTEVCRVLIHVYRYREIILCNDNSLSIM